jgi:hypothetical protein
MDVILAGVVIYFIDSNSSGRANDPRAFADRTIRSAQSNIYLAVGITLRLTKLATSNRIICL